MRTSAAEKFETIRLVEEAGLPAKRVLAELAAEHPKSARAVAEAASDLVGGEVFDEKSAQGLVLALGRGMGFEEEAGFFC